MALYKLANHCQYASGIMIHQLQQMCKKGSCITMKKLYRILSVLLVAALLCCTFVGCSEDTAVDETDPPETAGTPEGYAGNTDAAIVIGTLNADGAFMESLGGASFGYSLVYDSMLKYNSNSETMEYEPNLVTEWAFNDDCTELVLTFRDDVYFSNGEQMTPEDALFSMHTYVDAASISSTFYTEINWDACVVDGNDLTIVFHNPCPAFLATISAPTFGAVLSKDYIESTEVEACYTTAVGTGPYTLEEVMMGSYSVYQRRDDYWGELPDAEQITIKYYTEPTAMFIDFETGGIDVAVGISEADLVRMQNGETGGWYTVSPLNDYINLTLPEYNEAFPTSVSVRRLRMRSTTKSSPMPFWASWA